MTDIVVVGTGGMGREAHQIIEDLVADGERLNFLGFLDDDKAKHGKAVHDRPVLGGLSWLKGRPEVAVVIGVGNSANRRRLAVRLQAEGPNPFYTLRHPSAWVGNRIELGEGLILCPGVKLTTDIKIGRHVLINTNCTVAHDSVLGDFVTLAPAVNLSGAVKIGDGCELGINCAVIQGVEIGPWTIVGAGAFVSKPLPGNVTAVGLPARSIKERDDGWHV